MNQAISKTIMISAFAATMLLGAFNAQAQGAYSGDTGHYLQAPQGSQQPTARQSWNGQGMGQGQLQASQQTNSQPAAPLTVTTTPASSRMLPQGYTAQSNMVPQAMAPVAMPMAKPVTNTTRLQAASMPSVQPSVQALAAMEPAAGSAFDSNTNVQVAPSCGTPSNHRQHKGINTSTTVGNDCFN